MTDRPDDTIQANQAPSAQQDVPQSRTWPDGSALIVTSDAIALEPRPAY